MPSRSSPLQLISFNIPQTWILKINHTLTTKPTKSPQAKTNETDDDEWRRINAADRASSGCSSTNGSKSAIGESLPFSPFARSVILPSTHLWLTHARTSFEARASKTRIPRVSMNSARRIDDGVWSVSQRRCTKYFHPWLRPENVPTMKSCIMKTNTMIFLGNVALGHEKMWVLYCIHFVISDESTISFRGCCLSDCCAIGRYMDESKRSTGHSYVIFSLVTDWYVQQNLPDSEQSIYWKLTSPTTTTTKTPVYSGITVTLLAQHDNLPSILAITYCTICGLALASHAKTMFTDPGTIPQAAVPCHLTTSGTQTTHTMCAHCQSYKPPESHHCRICNRCVSHMDHHCPWMNNCVGAGNLSEYMLLL